MAQGKAPVGITAPIQPGGVFPTVHPQSVGKEKDRAWYLHSNVWGNTTGQVTMSTEAQADELLQKEVPKGHVQRAENRSGLEREVDTLHLGQDCRQCQGRQDEVVPRFAEERHQ